MSETREGGPEGPVGEAERVVTEDRFRAMIEHGADVIWLIGADRRIAYASPSTARVLGYAPAELVGTSGLELIVDEDREGVERATAELLRQPGAGRVVEFRVRHKDGSVRWIESARSNLLADPTVAAVVSNFRDVTARKHTESVQRDNQALLQAAQAVAHLGSWSSGASPDLPISWSPECARIFGRTDHSPPTALEFLQMVHPDDRQHVIEASQRALTEGVPCETEHRIVQPSGAVRWVLARAVIEGAIRWTREHATSGRDPASRDYHVVGVIQDITEQRRITEELRTSEARYRRILEHTSEGVWMYDTDARTTFMNPRMAAMLGWSVEEAIGQPIYAFMDEEGRITARERVARRKRGIGERGEFRLIRRDGSDLWVSLHADPIFDQAGNVEGVLALTTDITDQRAADELRRLLASIVSSSRDAILSRGVDGVIRTWNRGAEDLTRYTAAEAIGRHISMLYPPEDVVRLTADRDRVDAGQTLEDFEMMLVRKDGSRVEVSLTASTLVGENGSIEGASIIARDISERRKAEAALRRSEAQLAQAQKMQAIGGLAGGVAHDFNNLLSVILSYTEMMLEELPAADPLRSDLEEIQGAGRRATELTRQLLAFSRKQLLQPVVLDLNQVVTGIERMLARVVGEDIELALLVAPSLGRIHADAGQVEQVIMNLVVNARDAMPRGGNLTIETSDATLDESYAEQHPGVSPGPYVMLAITDTGIGMDRATQAQIFEPFFTTKDKSKGTGLGLSTGSSSRVADTSGCTASQARARPSRRTSRGPTWRSTRTC